MLKTMDVAKYFLNKDVDKRLFTKTLINRNGRTFYEGNARLNKFLHLAQNIYYAKTGRLLMDDDFYAYDNGAVVPTVQEGYTALLSHAPFDIRFPPEETDFLDRFFKAFQNAELDELIELSHEDSEWLEKHTFYNLPEQKMDIASRRAEYQAQYADIIAVLERMEV